MNLTRLLERSRIPVSCFAPFLAETRSSTPFDAVLKDFVGRRSFNTCGIEVTKGCRVTLRGGDTVTNTGELALDDVAVAAGDFASDGPARAPRTSANLRDAR